MSTMNISLTEPLKEFVEKKVKEGGYSTNSEYVRSLLRKEQEISAFKEMIYEGVSSDPLTDEPCDQAYFQRLRDGIGERSK